MTPINFGIHLKVKNFGTSLQFYLSLGFKPVFVYGDNNLRNQFSEIPSAPEEYNGITFNINNALFEIADGHIVVKSEIFKEEITNSKVSAMIDVDTLEEVFSICKKNNYLIAKDITEYPWGTRELVIKDPDGFILAFREQTYHEKI